MAAHWLAGTATDIKLTTAWNVNASYEHFWSPRWRTSIHGGYAEVKYSESGQCHSLHCAGLWYWCCWCWRECGGQCRLRQQLELVVGRHANPVERHQGLLHGPRCRLHQDQRHERARRGVTCWQLAFPAGTNTGARTITEQDEVVVPVPRASRLLSVIV